MGKIHEIENLDLKEGEGGGEGSQFLNLKNMSLGSRNKNFKI